jgi:uncharacterized protein YceH (UPF0502 family)
VEPLNDEELRVLGCLIEKEATVPDTYPLTLNSLRQACNQSSSRDPVVSYDDLVIQRALDSLKARGLARFVHPAAGERATKFRHVLHERTGLEPDELAVLCVLMLRGPQTAGELRTRTDRQYAFDSVGDVESTLRRLAARDEPIVVELPRQAGHQHIRWMHLLGGPIDVEALATEAPQRVGATAGSLRFEALVAEVEALRARVERIEAALGLSAPESEAEEHPDYS